jgi:hypothetical protein
LCMLLLVVQMAHSYIEIGMVSGLFIVIFIKSPPLILNKHMCCKHIHRKDHCKDHCQQFYS